jgi:hypothetical protein
MALTSPPLRLAVFDQSNRQVDSLDMDDEEPFTLDSLSALVQQYSTNGKKLILARVETHDPRDPTRSTFFYYNAHHLNKVREHETEREDGAKKGCCRKCRAESCTDCRSEP